MNKTMNQTLAILGGIGAGAAAMYFLDPDRGARRRALVRDKAVGLKNDAEYAIAGKVKDLKNRAQGLAHEAKGLLSHAETLTESDSRMGNQTRSQAQGNPV